MTAFSKVEAAKVEGAWVGETPWELCGEGGAKWRMTEFPGEMGAWMVVRGREERGEDAGECPEAWKCNCDTRAGAPREGFSELLHTRFWLLHTRGVHSTLRNLIPWLRIVF